MMQMPIGDGFFMLQVDGIEAGAGQEGTDNSNGEGGGVHPRVILDSRRAILFTYPTTKSSKMNICRLEQMQTTQ